MKLIDLLVRELPKHGGWPIEAVECERFVDESNIDFYDHYGNWDDDCSEKYGANFAQECVREKGYSGEKERVSREEYEDSIAALKQPAWNGEGLPPVGCECELFDCENWNPVIIKFVGDKYVVTERTDLGYEVVYCVAERPERFRPILTEEEVSRAHAVEFLAQIIEYRHGCNHVAMGRWIYDAIAGGEIPHITLK